MAYAESGLPGTLFSLLDLEEDDQVDFLFSYLTITPLYKLLANYSYILNS